MKPRGMSSRLISRDGFEKRLSSFLLSNKRSEANSNLPP
jgi:hypothetical protein